jgi:hypothetical protein
MTYSHVDKCFPDLISVMGAFTKQNSRSRDFPKRIKLCYQYSQFPQIPENSVIQDHSLISYICLIILIGNSEVLNDSPENDSLKK